MKGRKLGSWLWHEHPIMLPGWLIVFGLWWAFWGVIADATHIAEWVLRTF